MVKWNKTDYAGTTSKDGKWYIQASRDVNDRPVSWSVFDNTKENEWLDDRLKELDTLADAKAYVEKLANKGE